MTSNMIQNTSLNDTFGDNENMNDIDDNHPIRILPFWYIPFYITLCTIIMLISFIGNVTLLTVITRTAKLRTPTNYFLLSLVTADLLTTLFLMPLYIERYLDSKGSDWICLLRKYLFLMTSSGSIMSLALVSMDRMIAISYPFFYEKRITKYTALKILIVLWVWTLSFNCITFYDFAEWDHILTTCLSGLPKSLYLTLTPIGFYIPGLIIICAYIKIFLIARKHHVFLSKRVKTFSESSYNDVSQISRSSVTTNYIMDSPDFRLPRIRSETEISIASCTTQSSLTSIPPQVNNCTPKLNRKRAPTVLSALNDGKKHIKRAKEKLKCEMKATKTISLLVGMFLFCWSPIAAYYIYINASNRELEFEDAYGYLHDFFMFLSFVNAAVDPYLYTLRNKSIKTCTFKMLAKLSKMFHKPH